MHILLLNYSFIATLLVTSLAADGRLTRRGCCREKQQPPPPPASIPVAQAVLPSLPPLPARTASQQYRDWRLSYDVCEEMQRERETKKKENDTKGESSRAAMMDGLENIVSQVVDTVERRDSPRRTVGQESEGDDCLIRPASVSPGPDSNHITPRPVTFGNCCTYLRCFFDFPTNGPSWHCSTERSHFGSQPLVLVCTE